MVNDVCEEPFHPEKFKNAFNRTGTYTCGQNFFRHNLLWTATNSVPRRQFSMDALEDAIISMICSY